VTNVSAAVPKVPEMARVYPRTRGPGDLERHPSDESTIKGGPSIMVKRSSTAKEDDLTDPGSPPEDPARWSWTNSQAPPTPRMYAPSLRSSLGSLPRFRKVKSWVRNQSGRQGTRIDEERGPAGIAATAGFKNQASKPNLAPRQTRKLSKKSLRRESESGTLIIQSNADLPVIPTSANLRDERDLESFLL
jgi:hypothetical protein